MSIINKINMSGGDYYGGSSSAEEDDHRRPTPSVMRACRHRCKRIHAGSISNLCSATLGAGALSLPFAISLTGIVFGVLLLLFSAYLTIVSIDVIIEACVRTQLFKYEDVSVQLVGKGAGRVLEASLLVFCFGTAVAYIVAVGDILDQGLKSIPHVWGSSLTAMYSRENIMVLFWAFIMFPLSLQRNVEALERFSPLGVLSIIFLVLAVVIHSVAHGDIIGEDYDETQQLPPPDIGIMLWPKSFWDIIQAFPIIIFAFSCQVNVCAIYEELTPADTANAAYDEESSLKYKQRIMKRITRNGIMLCVTLYICIGLFGFLDFKNETADNILNNYCIQKTHDVLMVVASSFVAVAVVVAFPFNILPARVTLKLILERMRNRRRCRSCHGFFSSVTFSNFPSPWAMKRRGSNVTTEEGSESPSSPKTQYGSNDEFVDGSQTDATEPLLEDDRFGDRPSLVPHMSLEGLPITIQEEETYSTESTPLEHFLLTLLLSGSALIVALLIPGISVVFGLMGGTAASIISFILPGMFLMEANRNNGQGRRKFLPLVFVWGGTLIGILSTFVTIYGLFSPGDNDAVATCGSINP